MVAVKPHKHFINLNEWRKMGVANIFAPESRLELIEGEIIEMSPIGFNHSGHINRLTSIIVPLITDKAVSSIQNPLQLDDYSEPQPDFMLLRPKSDFYSTAHPHAEDVLLLIEVADSSLAFDRNQKLLLYASHSIPEYWILNLDFSCLEVYRQPHEHGYAKKIVFKTDDQVTLSQLDNITLDVAEIL